MRKSLLTMAVLAMSISAAPAFADDEEMVGTLLGAGVGGLLGSTIGHGDGRLVATAAGAFIGGVAGDQLARSTYQVAYAPPAYAYYSYDMFPSQGFFARPYHDQPYVQPTYVAPPAPPPAPPVTYVDDTSGQYCRQFSQRVRIDNHMQEVYGTACLQPDGSWHVVQ